MNKNTLSNICFMRLVLLKLFVDDKSFYFIKVTNTLSIVNLVGYYTMPLFLITNDVLVIVSCDRLLISDV